MTEPTFSHPGDRENSDQHVDLYFGQLFIVHLGKHHFKFKPVYFYWCETSPFPAVCVEVLRPSQPNGVMSSAVSLPNHTFTGQA